jgi:hypothetical protein
VPRPIWIIVLVALASVFGLSFDLVSRTRQLLREGYTHEDIRLASLLERQVRERELQSLLGDATARARRRRGVRAAAKVAGSAFVGIVITSLLKRFVPGLPHSVVMVAGFAAIAAFMIGVMLALTGSVWMQRSNLLYYNAVWRRWFGRWLFRFAGLGLRRARVSASTPGIMTLIADLSDSVPTSDRAALRDAAELFTRLGDRASDLLLKERELDQAITEVGAPPAVPTQLGTSPLSETASTGYSGTPARTLRERRSSGLAHLRAARDETAQQRASVQLAADNLRIQLLRLRAGAGTIGDLEHDVLTAHRLLESPHA